MCGIPVIALSPIRHPTRRSAHALPGFEIWKIHRPRCLVSARSLLPKTCAGVMPGRRSEAEKRRWRARPGST